jgi:hypothetical protein
MIGGPRFRRWELVFLVITAVSPMAAAQSSGHSGPRHVGIVLDGPSPNTEAWRAEFEREILAFFGADGPIDFPAEYRVEGDWAPTGARAALDRLLAPGGADIVLALGPIASNELAHRRTIPKPSIAAPVIDAAVQQLPAQHGASGESLEESLLDAGIMRLRPVLITGGATVLALVPVLYALFVLDLKIVQWETHPGGGHGHA